MARLALATLIIVLAIVQAAPPAAAVGGADPAGVVEAAGAAFQSNEQVMLDLKEKVFASEFGELAAWGATVVLSKIIDFANYPVCRPGPKSHMYGAGLGIAFTLALSIFGSIPLCWTEAAAMQLIEELMAARRGRIVVYGVGREGLAMKGFLMRLHHMGLQASVVGEMTAARVGQGDLLLASAGPGWFSTVQALSQEARRDGARVVLITSQLPAAAAQLVPAADAVLQVPATCLPPAGTQEPAAGHTDVAAASAAAAGAAAAAAGAAPPESPLLMGSSYELALQLLFDIVCVLLKKQLGLSDADMAARHTNLE